MTGGGGEGGEITLVVQKGERLFVTVHSELAFVLSYLKYFYRIFLF